MATTSLLVASALLATALAVVVKLTLHIFKKTPGPLPPGPKGLPLLGCLNGLPGPGEPGWEHWAKHKTLYGPISSVTVLGKTIVLLNSAELTTELLERRSANYSSRPRMPFGEFVGFGESMPLMMYDKKFRHHRKIIHSMMGSHTAVQPYIPLQEKEAHRMLFRILQKPDALLDHIKIEAAAIMLKILYGYTVDPHKPDRLVKVIDDTMEIFGECVLPGTWMVDVIPALQYVPKWMPGGGWKKTGEKWRATLIEAVERPVKFARQRLARGCLEESFLKSYYEQRDEPTEEDHYHAKWSAFSMYGGGADTSVNTLATFFLAMTISPEVQRKAQEEIDRVIGTDRLPTYNDRHNLPYVNAVVSEAWRWHPVLPLITPHGTEADDMINGYFIPKGALVIANAWFLTHDPEIYPEPSRFDPSRFLGPSPAPDPTKHAFGYGRRICPGRFLALTSVWINIAQALAVFDIGKGRDEKGREIEPNVAFTTGLISRPEDLKATIKPRSPQHEALIRQVEQLHPWEESSANEL